MTARPRRLLWSALATALLLGATPASAAPTAATPTAGPNYGWEDASPPNPPGYAVDTLTGVWSDGVDVWAVGSTSEDDAAPAAALPWGVRCDDTSCALLDLVSVTDPDYTNVTLADIGGTSANDVWAVGQSTLGDPTDPDGRYSALIQHFDGTSWSVVDTSALPYVDLRSVVAVAVDDVWAMGCLSFCTWDATVVLLHWDGSAWSDVSAELPEAYAAGGMDPAPDLAAVDGRLYLPLGGDLLVRSGGTWTVALDRAADVFGVGVVDGRVWAVGGRQSEGSVMNAKVWTEHGAGWRQLPSPGQGAGLRLLTVTGTDAGNVWVGGLTGGANGVGWTVLRWTGSTWSRTPAPMDGAWTDSGAAYSVLDSTIGPDGRPWIAGWVTDACDCGTGAVLRRGPAPVT